MRPEILALRAANQYRARDVVAYIGLRYFFANVCARRDKWANEVSTHLVRTRSRASYFQLLHYKDFVDNHEVHHRSVFIPGPNEAFAEAALLAECSQYDAFTPLPCVFSYHLAKGSESQGVYVPYFEGFRKRHEQTRDACSESPQSIVLYTDIKKFYPSIRAKNALDAWNYACEESKLPSQWRTLGLKLLSDHSQVALLNEEGVGLLTGPMFSHLIANLVLRKVDEKMTQTFPKRYFRYVDDVVLVGTSEQVAAGREMLTKLLAPLNLFLHDQDKGKDFEVEGLKWLEGASDFESLDGIQWAGFVSNLKHFLVSQPESYNSLAEQFRALGFRIPLPVYSLDIKNAPWLLRLRTRLNKYPWLKNLLMKSSPQDLILTAQLLREQYGRALQAQINYGISEDRYTRKRAIPKLRFLAGRILYLGSKEMLLKFSEALQAIPELRMFSSIMYAVAMRDVSHLLQLGTNAVQSAAQVLCLSTEPVSCKIDNWTTACLQGIAVLRFNGLAVDGPSDDPLNRLATWSENSSKLMAADNNPVLRELACLHGKSESGRHADTLRTVFDWDETLAFDAINQMTDSDY